MPPTNTSFGAATVIGSLPYDFTQTDINDAGVNYSVFYKFTAPTDSVVIGAWGWSGNVGVGYQPDIEPYNASQISILSISHRNMPIQFPVTAGQDYYLKFVKNVDTAGPESLRVRIQVAPNLEIERGNFFVNDDTQGFPLGIFSHSVDYQTRRFVQNIAAGEAGDILGAPYYNLCIENAADNTVQLFSPSSFSLLYTSPAMTGTIRLKRGAAGNKFYIADGIGNPANVGYRTLSNLGVLSSRVVIPVTFPRTVGALCANADDTILYYGEAGADGIIRRWDIPGAAPLSNLAAAITDYRIADIQVYDDGNIVVLYQDVITSPHRSRILVYSAAGATLHNYDLGTDTDSLLPRMAWDLVDTSVWVMTHTIPDGISRFRQVQLSDGTILDTVLHQSYELGTFTGDQTATPTARFGPSQSCPFMMMTWSSVNSGIYILTTNLRNDLGEAIPAPTFRTALIP